MSTISFDDKWREIIPECSMDTARFALLVYTLSTSANQPVDQDEFLRIVLGFTQNQVNAARAEFRIKLEAWNLAHGVSAVEKGKGPL